MAPVENSNVSFHEASLTVSGNVAWGQVPNLEDGECSSQI